VPFILEHHVYSATKKPTELSHLSILPPPSHAGTVVPECYKDESQWKNLKFDPRHPKKCLNQWLPKLAGVTIPDIYSCAKIHYDPVRQFCPPPVAYAKLPIKCSLGYFWVL